MENCSTFEELNEYFTDKVQRMTHTLLLRDSHKDDGDVELLRNLDNNISDLKILLFNMKLQLTRQKENVQQFQMLKEVMLSDKSDVQHMEGNLPAKLPKLVAPAVPPAQMPNRQVENNVSDAKPAETHKPARNVKVRKGPYIRSMDYLVVEEFDHVPKYMKGRISYDQVNHVVDEYNKALAKKYEILYMPKSEQTEQIKKRITAFKKQESKDTTGFYFLVEEDLGKLSSLKMDSVARSVLTILRHTGRLKLIRGGGIARHALA